MRQIIYNIGTLAGILPEGVLKLEGAQMNEVNCIGNAYLVIEDGIISDFGPMVSCPSICHSEEPATNCHSEEPEGRREDLLYIINV